jgi:hypothetical protein
VSDCVLERLGVCLFSHEVARRALRRKALAKLGRRDLGGLLLPPSTPSPSVQTPLFPLLFLKFVGGLSCLSWLGLHASTLSCEELSLSRARAPSSSTSRTKPRGVNCKPSRTGNGLLLVASTDEIKATRR